jgi:hypothetical protein
MPQLAGPLGALSAQVPRLWPDGMVQAPVQQSPFVAQASPACTQNDDASQWPPLQSPEQQAALVVHALPRVEHDVLSAVQVPLLPHAWLQHCEPAVHARPSDWQAGYWQKPFVQSELQQSPFALQEAPSWRHVPVPAPPPNTSGDR